jgi:prolipoprotein diacylglyceryl transferase
VVLPLSIPSPSGGWQVFNLGQWLRDIGWTSFGLDINLRASTLCIIIGIVVAIMVTSRRLTKRGAEPGIVIDLAVGAVILGLIGGRLLHVLTHLPTYVGPGIAPVHIIALWEGGFSLYGAIGGGVIGVAIAAKIDGLRLPSVLDAAVPGILLATAAQRVGDWFDNQSFGGPTSAPWGVEIPKSNPSFPVGLPSSTIFQPVFLYEFLWCLLGVAVLLFLEKRMQLQWGKLFALYLVWYGLGRSWFESLRIDPSLHFGGLRTNVWISWLVVVIGIIFYLAQRSRHVGVEPSVYIPGRVWTPEPEVHSEDTYTDTAEGNDALAETTNSGSVLATRSVTSGAGTK